MVLTQEYCESICLPFGFVTACKQKIRQRKVENQDRWALNAKEATQDNFDSASSATTPLPPQVANDPRKLKEHHRRTSQEFTKNSMKFPNDHESWHDGMSDGGRSGRSPRLADEPSTAARHQNYRDQGMSREDLQATIASSQNVILNELREMKRSQMEEHSRIKMLEEKVEKDIDQVQGMMGGMMTQVMDRIELRLRTPSQAASQREQSNPFGSGHA
jgi:hypothetical protein